MNNICSYYVNGKWKKSASGETIDIMSPYLREKIGEVQAITKEEVDEAINSAILAQKDWKALTISKRGEYLYKWSEELLISKEEIAEVIMREVGKSKSDSIKEVERTSHLIKYTVEEAIHMNGESILGENFPGGSSSKIATIQRVPLGVILAISPFNYPVNLAATKIAPALISGNTVIFKPATQGSMSGIKMIEALHRTGIQKGVINLVTGKGSVIGDYLIEHSGINMVSFTGGTETGHHISEKAKMIPLVMELGGKDPAIICEDADLKLATKEIISGAYSYSGQRCTAIKRVIVNESIADELGKLLKKEVDQLSVGSPEEDNIIVPLIDNKSADYVQSLIDDALDKGAKLLSGNKKEGNLIYPTLLDHVKRNMRIAWEEPFGPVLPLIRVKSDEEAIKLANESEYGLQASVFTENVNKAFLISSKIEAGSVQINGRTERGPDNFPFIGTKSSGMGTQGVRRSIESMTREKVIILNVR